MKGISLALACLSVVVGVGCTVHQTEAPGLTGPSEAALSVSVTAIPDAITQDGASVSTISVVSRDANGQLLGNRSFRLDMKVNGQVADFGTLSSRTITTGSDGRATALYTAPAAPPAGALAGTCDGGSASATLGGNCVQIVATSLGSDYSAAASHVVEIRLVPTSVIVPASASPVPAFTVATPSPASNAPVLFDASKSCASALDSSGSCSPLAGTITGYLWNFGDGGTATGKTASHTFTRQQTFLVTLTVTNDRGLSASTTDSVQVGAGSLPTAVFNSSPTGPAPGQDIFFDATLSRPGVGHNIVRYVWNWGDGDPLLDTSQPTAKHAYKAAGSYVVTLNIADEAGQGATVTNTIKVVAP